MTTAHAAASAAPLPPDAIADQQRRVQTLIDDRQFDDAALAAVELARLLADAARGRP